MNLFFYLFVKKIIIITYTTKIICFQHFTIVLFHAYWIIGVRFTILVFVILIFLFDLMGFFCHLFVSIC